MSLKLSDKQREFLSAAAEREDGLLAIPPQLKGATAQKVGAKLVAAGLAKGVKAKSGGPVWRRDAETEQAYALKLTAAGLNAVRADAKRPGEGGRLSGRALPSHGRGRRFDPCIPHHPVPANRRGFRVGRNPRNSRRLARRVAVCEPNSDRSPVFWA